MKLCMSEWSQLDVGIYLHRWRPQLLVVRNELYPNPAVRRCLDPEQWKHIGQYVYEWVMDTFSEAAAADIEISDVRVVEECGYVV